MKDYESNASNTPATANSGFQGSDPTGQDGTPSYDLTDEQLYFCIISKK